MRLKFSIFPCWKRFLALWSQVRWCDPLTQTWGLIGGLLIVGIAGHYGRGAASGEKKNSSGLEALFYKNDVAVADAWQPGVPFLPDACAASIPPAQEPDLRAFADKAARQPGWQYVSAPLRERLTAVSTGISGITVTWSGTRGGNANALDLYFTGTRGQTGGAPDDFVIGNGCRGKDGQIETTRHWNKTLAQAGAPDATGISICLIGESQKPTPAQEAALGELITCIEARTGTTTLAMRRPRDSGLLAKQM